MFLTGNVNALKRFLVIAQNMLHRVSILFRYIGIMRRFMLKINSCIVYKNWFH